MKRLRKSKKLRKLNKSLSFAISHAIKNKMVLDPMGDSFVPYFYNIKQKKEK